MSISLDQFIHPSINADEKHWMVFRENQIGISMPFQAQVGWCFNPSDPTEYRITYGDGRTERLYSPCSYQLFDTLDEAINYIKEHTEFQRKYHKTKIRQFNAVIELLDKIDSELYSFEKNVKLNHNQFALEHHQKIIEKGYWNRPKEIGTLFMLIITEITKLFDEERLNKSEKLADIALRIYDLCGYYRIDLETLPKVDKCEFHDMLSMLTNEIEAKRAHVKTGWVYLKKCLSMTWLYAEKNNIDLVAELCRKSEILQRMDKKQF